MVYFSNRPKIDIKPHDFNYVIKHSLTKNESVIKAK